MEKTEIIIDSLLDVIDSNIGIIEDIAYQEGGVWANFDTEPLKEALDKVEENNRLTGIADIYDKHSKK